MRTASILGSLLAISLLAGCRCGDDRPYTPFGVASAVEAAAPPPSASVAEEPDAAAPPAFAGKAALIAPAGATRWQLAGKALVAPQGRAFERGVSADFDADGTEEAVVWTVASGATAAPGELWLHPANGAAKRLLALPGFVPAGPTCKHVADLRQTGPRTVTLDVRAECEGQMLARTAKRAVVVAAPLSDRPQVIALRVAEPAPGEKLTLAVDSTDKDNDARDDVRVTVTVSREGSKRPATGALVWFDRAAGVSRDAAEPAASLAGMGSLALGRSQGKKSAEGVAETAESTRRLMSTLCAESGVARLFDADGAALSCGKLGTVVDRLALAETRAAITRGDLLAAAGALARDGWYFGAASEKTKKQMIQALEKATQKLEPAAAATLEARPVTRTDAPRFSPLSFEGSGALLVMTSSGVVRVSPDGREESDSATQSWPLEVSSDGGARWTGLAHACDRNETLLIVSGQAPPIVSSLLAPRPGGCRGGAAPKQVPTAPLAWKTNGLEALIALAHVGPKTSVAEVVLRPQTPGSPRSPDGRLLVTPMPLGLLVIGTPKPELWKTSTPDWTSLTDCTVANEAKSVTCVSGGRVLVWRRP